jgi:undecaprenyl-diphosphatase
MFPAVVLGMIQGITEFFPISSTAHLVLIPWFFHWQGTVNSLTFDVALHAGTLMSLLVSFRRDILDMLGKKRNLLFLIVLGTVPAAAAGLAWEDQISGSLRDPSVIAIALVVFGIVMYYAERFLKGKKMEGMNARDSLFVGVAQAVALVPGVSRSGITIAAGLMRGVKREEAARFSFLLSIPVVAGATLLEGRKLLLSPEQHDVAVIGAGFVSALVTGLFAIRFMLGFLKRHSMNVFIIYRFVLAGIIVGWGWLAG